MKTCCSCGLTLTLDCFYAAPRNKDGYAGKCKECMKAYSSMRSKAIFTDEWNTISRDEQIRRNNEYLTTRASASTIEAMKEIRKRADSSTRKKAYNATYEKRDDVKAKRAAAARARYWAKKKGK